MYVLVVDDDISVQIPYAKPFYTMFKSQKLSEFETKWKSMSSQGRIAREIDGCTDSRFSSAFLCNHKLSDDIRSFVCRGRLQLLQCNSLLHLYYGIPKSCKICNHPTDTASHILNGCTQFKQMYQNRHNRIVDIIYNKIESTNKSDNVEVLKDCILTPAKLNSAQAHFIHPNKRPDIVTIDRDAKTVTITEISIPFDAHMKTTYKSKFDKYYPLSLEVNDLGYSTMVIVLIIGSLGNVHCRFVSGLRKNNMNSTEAKYLARYCSISAIIGSHKVWKTRCKELGN